MLKSFCLQALRLIVLGLLLVQMAVGSALAQGIQSPQEASPQSPKIENKQEEMMPARSESATDEIRTATPSKRVSESTSSPRASDKARPADPYAKYYEAIKNFNEEVYGEGG